MIKDREGGRYMRWRNHRSRYYLDRHIRFNFLHDKFKGKLNFEGWDTKEKNYSKNKRTDWNFILAFTAVVSITFIMLCIFYSLRGW